MPRKILHPNFRRKSVLRLECRLCEQTLCTRGMRAILLGDTNLQLYSTDSPPYNAVDQVGEAYSTAKCHCRIKDIACLKCGNVVGYTVTLPCKTCLSSCNNGHFWMFHNEAVRADNRVDKTGERILTWSRLLAEDDDEIISDPETPSELLTPTPEGYCYEDFCR